MGKSLVIKGADFSANGIAPEFIKLKSIISTSNTQVIMSSVSFPTRGKIVYDYKHPASVAGNLFGFAANSVMTPQQTIYVNVLNNGSFNYEPLAYINNGNSYVRSNKSGVNDGNKHVFEVSRYGWKLDNVALPALPQNTCVDSISIGIFGCKEYIESKSRVAVGLVLYNVKMYSDYENTDSLILDAIPVKRLSDNKICLYDKVSGTYLLTNDGTNPDYETLD